MVAVLFHVEMEASSREEYLRIASELSELLKGTPGFISIERYKSLTDDSKTLSLSYWVNMKAVDAWKGQSDHRQAQSKGRNELFSSYTIHVAEVVRSNEFTRTLP